MTSVRGGLRSHDISFIQTRKTDEDLLEKVPLSVTFCCINITPSGGLN